MYAGHRLFRMHLYKLDEFNMFQLGHIPAHKGKSTTTDPLKSLEMVAKVKELLKNDVRDFALFTLAINTALRSGDLCNLRWSDIQEDGSIRVLEGKTKKPRLIPLNEGTQRAVLAWRALCESEFIYSGQRGQLTTAAWGRMVKHWCRQVGLQGNFAGHTARKTFVRIQHDEFGTTLPVLMTILNHTSERVTLTYMGRLGDDVKRAYEHAL